MHLIDTQDEPIISAANTMRGLTKELLKGLAAAGDARLLTNSDDIFASQPNTRLYLVKSGKVVCRRERKTVYIAEAGDLIGLGRSLKLPEGPFCCNEPVELIPYHRDQLVNHVNSSKELQKHWAFFLLCRCTFFSESLRQEVRSQFNPATGFLSFDEGDVIINQGDNADCVYTLLEGSADALRDGVKVGEIHSEEIFGAMAVFTRQPRSATVVASAPCSVLAVKKEEFLDLIAEQPQVCRSLLEEMAAKIVQLNQKLAQLKS